MDLEALGEALRHQRIKACLAVPNFSNPLGSLMPDDAKKKKLVEMLARRDIPLIEDDIYGDLHFGEARPKPAKCLDREGLVMPCSSFSKTLASGYRVGWVAPRKFRERIERLKFEQTIATPTLPQMAVTEFLENGGYDHHLRQMRRKLASQVQRMAEAIAERKSARSGHQHRSGHDLFAEAALLELHSFALRFSVVGYARARDPHPGPTRGRASARRRYRVARTIVRRVLHLSIALALLAVSAMARADEPDTLEAVDGTAGCDALEVKNDKELKVYSSLQPPTRYVYPQAEEILGAPWVELGGAAKDSLALIAATLIPHVGPVLRGPTPETMLSWPWSFPIGPPSACSRRRGGYDIAKYRPFRLMFEPGIDLGQTAVVVSMRPGARYIYHPTAWPAGLGGGLGSMIELSGKEPLRASLSPEIVVQLGRCCEPGYFMVGIRHEFFFAGKNDLWSASVGFTYF